MLPDCKKISEMSSENIDEPLTGLKWLKMKFHFIICAYCRRYGEQMVLSSKTIELLDKNTQPNEEVRKNVERSYKELHGKTKKTC